MSQSGVSIGRDDLAAMLTVYGVSRQLRRALLKLHAEAEVPGMLDRGDLPMHEDLRKWIGFEQDATAIHNYETLPYPGYCRPFLMRMRS